MRNIVHNHHHHQHHFHTSMCECVFKSIFTIELIMRKEKNKFELKTYMSSKITKLVVLQLSASYDHRKFACGLELKMLIFKQINQNHWKNACCTRMCYICYSKSNYARMQIIQKFFFVQREKEFCKNQMIYVFTLDSLSCIARYRPMLEFALSFAFLLIRSLSFTHLASLALRNLQLDCLGRSFL